MVAHTTVFGKQDAEVVRLAPAWRRVRDAHAPATPRPSVPISSTEPDTAVPLASA
jgi:hypothetical protein